MSRYVFRIFQVMVDLGILGIAFGLSFFLRFEGAVPTQALKLAAFAAPYVVLFQYGMLTFYGVPNFAWRYVGLREAKRIALALGIATALMLTVRLVAGLLIVEWSYARYLALPIGVLLVNLALAFLGIVGIRVIRRMLAEQNQSSRLREVGSPRIPTLLIGAGQGGVMVAKEIDARPDLGIEPVGFLDDDPMKAGTLIHGVPVLGTTADLPRLTVQTGARQALITFANAPGPAIRAVKQRCGEAGIPVKIIPGLYEIVGGSVNLSRIREVAIEDLLRREPVQLDDRAIAEIVRGKVALVTGAGGSIGSELCRQLAGFRPRRIVLLERAENNLFEIHRELAGRFPEVEIVPAMADVCDSLRVEGLLREHCPRVIFHAAAHKHVPMMEANAGEAIKNNVLGTKTVADLADRLEIGTFVMISTDKAVNPTSVMGASKRVAEIYLQALSERSGTCFVTVRFGNVLGSTGSVIPIFKQQIAEGGPVTVTHPDMRRYFMTIPEACQLVLQAGSMGRGGEIFILDMGEPVRIVDLANDLIALSGLVPGQDIDVEFTGVRPGEKLYEELSVEDEQADKTRHPHIFVGRVRSYGWPEAVGHVERLARVSDSKDSSLVRHALADVVPEYRLPATTAAIEIEPSCQLTAPLQDAPSAEPSPA